MAAASCRASDAARDRASLRGRARWNCALPRGGHFSRVVSFRKCEICGRSLEGPASGQQEVEHRRIDPAAGAALQRQVPRDLPPEAVCEECLEAYRKLIGQPDPQGPLTA